MSNTLSSPTINKAIGKLTRKYLDNIGLPMAEVLVKDVNARVLTLDQASSVVVQVLDLLGFLGVLDYSKFNPDEVSEKLGVMRLEVETLDKESN